MRLPHARDELRMKYIDYGTMQSDAQRRVLEMQRRAQSAVHSQMLSGESFSADESCSDTLAQKLDVSQNEEKSALTPTKNDDNIRPIEISNGSRNEILQLLSNDPEQALLLTILLLLLTENADMVLILAILYMIL